MYGHWLGDLLVARSSRAAIEGIVSSANTETLACPCVFVEASLVDAAAITLTPVLLGRATN
jgi:hypothetical protein